MSRTVFLHVGVAKTGTTYLQRTLHASRHRLARHGTLFPGTVAAAHFFASLDLRSATFKGYADARVPGAWQRLVAEADAYSGNTLISHETFAHSKPEVIRRAVHAFSTDDVRVVITCRDLLRQLPAVWQESLKNRGAVRYDDYAQRVFDTWEPERRTAGFGFWTSQDVAALVDRWGAEVGAHNVWLVTVPPRGAPPGELLRRFAEATCLPDVEFAAPAAETNTSLGVGEAELLRRLNPRLKQALDWPHYDAQIKRHLVETALAGHESLGRLTIPQAWMPRLADITRSQQAALAASGAHVVGDLADLTGVPEPEGRQPSDLSDSEVLAVALDVLAQIAAEPHRHWSVSRSSLRGLLDRRSVLTAARTVREAGSRAIRDRRR